MAHELSIAEIDDGISEAQNDLSLFPRSDRIHIALATLRFGRYKLSQQKEDLENSILHCNEAIHYLPLSRAHDLAHDGPDLDSDYILFPLLFHLAYVLIELSEKCGQHDGVQSSIEYLRYLRELHLDDDSFIVSRNLVTTALIWALAIQVLLEAGDGAQNTKEMVDLCRELLTCNTSADFPVVAFIKLRQAVDVEYVRGRILSLDPAIECLRDAVKACQCPPDSYMILLTLANALTTRFMATQSNDDDEEATVIFRRILDPNQAGECPDTIRDRATDDANILVVVRSYLIITPQHSELSISRLRTILSSSSIDEGLRLLLTDALKTRTTERFEHYGLAESLDEANSYTSKIVDISQSLEMSEEVFDGQVAVMESSVTRMAAIIQHRERLLSTAPPGTQRHRQCLASLSRRYRLKFCRTDDISDIEESIKYGRLSVEANRSNDHWIFGAFHDLYNSLFLAFKKTSKVSYLDESIAVCYDLLESKRPQFLRFGTVQQLVGFFLIREQLLGRRDSDRHEAIRLLMSMVVDSQHVGEPDQFKFSCWWASLARSIDHSTTLTAYKIAMTLLQKSLSLAPTVSAQHAHLVAMGENCQTMPLNYASFEIDSGRFTEAVETLEQGRALLWSEIRGLRTSLAQLLESDSPLVKRFSEINQELEALTISATPSGRPEKEDGVAQDESDPFGRLVVKKRKLMEERDELVSQIQCQPALKKFLKAPSFTTLLSAASRGPVILINHSVWRFDILIICSRANPHFSCCRIIPTASDLYDRANELRSELLEARKHGLDSDKYQDALRFVLKGLYELVGEPVIENLQYLRVPEQSRIWWCPTSVFCSLPLHAMGPIPSSDTHKRYFSDMYIPSYTPSLTALIESRKASPQLLEKPSLLLVAQPDKYLPGVNEETKVIRVLEGRVTVKSLVSSEATPTSVVESLRGSHFAHFACHGMLETGKPFEASFKLHEGSRLTLLDIVRSRLPEAEFAFLSCCHTAEITEASIFDEALHLTAATQYCGFRSVVGTMWEMVDADGRDLAKNFYKSLFSSQEEVVPYHEQSARALRDATQKLRRKRGITLERWVNFVHYGA